MDNFNYQFFEEFTKLNKTCVSVYQLDGGILGYLVQMGDVSGDYADTIPNWHEDMAQLHRYRMIHQALVQSAEVFESPICDRSDVEWLKDFEVRIMERRDPLALLHKWGYRAEDDSKRRLEGGRSKEIAIQSADPRDRYINSYFLVGFILVAVVLTCLICTFVLPQL